MKSKLILALAFLPYIITVKSMDNHTYTVQGQDSAKKGNSLEEKKFKPGQEILCSYIDSSNHKKIRRLIDEKIITPDEKVFDGNLLHQALMLRKLDIINLLIEYGAQVTECNLCVSSRAGDEFFDSIVNRFDYAQISSGDKEYLYHRAAIEGTPHMLEKLKLLTHVHIDVQDCFGYTPLLNAVMERNSETVKFLLVQGANHKIVTNSGRTLEDCARDSDKEIRKIIKEFLTRKHFVESDSLFVALPYELTSIVLDYVVNNVN